MLTAAKKPMIYAGGEHADIIGCYLHIKMETRDFAQFEEIKRSLTAAGYHLV